MTVDASSANRPSIDGRRVDVTLVIDITRVALERMALLTQIRQAQLGRCRVIRAVRIVAVGAILAHRRMLPQHRAALFGVAVVTGFVDRGGLQIAGADAAMRIVAAQARHLALALRHVHGTLHLGALLDMATTAYLRRDGGAAGVNGVAISAIQLRHIVLTAGPVHAIPARMALQAGSGAVRVVLLAEILDSPGGARALFAGDLDVFGSAAMAGLAPDLLQVTLRIVAPRLAVCALHIGTLSILVTGEALLFTDVFFGCLLRRNRKWNCSEQAQYRRQ